MSKKKPIQLSQPQISKTQKEAEADKVPIPDHDTNWKKVISFFIEEFVMYFLPKLHEEVDWTKPVEFLEQEFDKIVKTTFKGKYVVDKLAKLHLKSGKPSFVLLNAEPQSTWESSFPRRMLMYYVHVDMYLSKKEFEFTAIAIYTGLDVPKKNNVYEHRFHGTNIKYEFNACVVEKLEESTLLASKSPIALALLAAKYEHQSRGKKRQQTRFGFKKKLVTLLYERNYSRTATRILLEFIRYVVVLPKKFDISFNEFVKTKIEKNMRTNISPIDKKWIDDLYVSVIGETPDAMIERKSQEAAKEIAKDMAQEMAQKIAKEIAEDMAQEMAKEIAQEMAQKAAKEMAKAATEKAVKLEKEKTAKQQKLVIAKALLAEQVFSNAQIAAITQLPLEEIETLVSIK